MRTRYFDKNGKEILPGMILRHDNGEEWLISETVDEDGNLGLGMSCNVWEAYPLWGFDLNEWEIAD